MTTWSIILVFSFLLDNDASHYSLLCLDIWCCYQKASVNMGRQQCFQASRYQVAVIGERNKSMRVRLYAPHFIFTWKGRKNNGKSESWDWWIIYPWSRSMYTPMVNFKWRKKRSVFVFPSDLVSGGVIHMPPMDRWTPLHGCGRGTFKTCWSSNRISDPECGVGTCGNLGTS